MTFIVNIIVIVNYHRRHHYPQHACQRHRHLHPHHRSLSQLTQNNHSILQIGCLSSTLFMLIFEKSEAALWLGTSGAGLFMSSVFPTSIALAEYYIDLTGEEFFIF